MKSLILKFYNCTSYYFTREKWIFCFKSDNVNSLTGIQFMSYTIANSKFGQTSPEITSKIYFLMLLCGKMSKKKILGWPNWPAKLFELKICYSFQYKIV